ncbi:ATP-dependent helicase smarcad1 [Boothiomyces sp. JEL0866]|nr:ATP-dependent helicase smarcad1 [Boothiomyces sp. JEL0866]KAJ3324587.1 ATP-dependent helicase smarcad1 [Boothiomyces sp. JEL0866]
MPNNQLHKTLTDHKCVDLINPESTLFSQISHYGAVPVKPITLDSSLSVREACHTLAVNRITSAPILNGAQLIGQLDYFDLLVYLLQALNSITLANMDEPEWTVKDILSHVITTSEPLSSLTTHKKLVTIQKDAPLLDVLDEFIRSKCHRLAVLEGNTFRGVISQTALAALVVYKFGLKKEKGAVWDLGNKSIKELGIIRKNVIFVNEKNTLRGSIGLSDIKLILAETNGVKLLTNTCKHFFQEIRKKQSLDHSEDTRVPNYVVGPDTTLIFAMEKMIATRSHRIWVVENHDKVVGFTPNIFCEKNLRSKIMFSSPNKPIIIIPETPLAENKKIAKPNRVPLFADYEESLKSASQLFEDVYGGSDISGKAKFKKEVIEIPSNDINEIDGFDMDDIFDTDHNHLSLDPIQKECSDATDDIDQQIIQIDSDDEFDFPKKRRRLVRKDQLKPQSSPDIQIVSSVTKDDDKEPDTIPENPKSDLIYESDDDDQHIADLITKLLNTESLGNIQESLLCSETQAQNIINHRPQNTYAEWLEVVDKGVHRLITKHFTKLQEFQSVEDIFIHCDDVSQEIQSILDSWNSKSKASKYPCLDSQPEFVTKDFNLFPYQLVGVSWLYLLFVKGLGGILADEMGLGKSCQVVTFLGLLKSKGEGGLNLIIVPATVLGKRNLIRDNWVRELNMWVPSLKVIAYTGDQNVRRNLQMKILECDDLDVIVTTYNQASGAMDRRFLRSLKCQSLILDEGHMIKNSSSQRALHLKNLNIPFRLLLTGTPLQNNLKELLALLTFIMPDLFGPCFDQLSIIFDDQKSKSYKDVISKLQIERAKKMMTPFILQRLKQDVQSSLPPKIYRTEYCARNDIQVGLYDKLLLASKDSSTKLSNVLMELRKLSNHQLLLRNHYRDKALRAIAKVLMNELEFLDSKEEYVFEDLQVMNDFQIHKLCSKYKRLAKYLLEESTWLNSGKISRLTELLTALKANGDRVLLFSQFVMMLDILELVLGTLNIKFLRLDGSTPSADRIQLIDDYNKNSEITVFLLSTKACGLGINLTSANTVIIYDMDFNPHNDIQAEDRAHRLGQKRPVTIYRLILKDTVEEHILNLVNSKLLLNGKLKEKDPSKFVESGLIDIIQKDLDNIP